jgi:phthalate 4,5-dioxygenase
MNAQDIEMLTRVGPGTPLNSLMRQYWIPAVASSELVPGGAPVRVLLLGEKLVAFRQKSGVVGILDHKCPHRCVSLFYGRNEDGGLRCSYHGWKFDTNGQCIDMPNVAPHQRFEKKVQAKAYPTYERAGLVWVYMGERSTVPPLPAMEATLVAPEDTQVSFVMRDCNWLQSLEGDIDTSHFGFLHGGTIDPETIPEDDIQRWALYNRAPEYHVADTDWGTMYAAYRKANPGMTYWRFAHFLMPFWTMVPDAIFADHIIARAWVPMDDTHTMHVMIRWTGAERRARLRKDGTPIPGLSFVQDYLPNSTDWYGRWRLRANIANDHFLDREGQSEVYSGVSGVHLQDQAITESMGPIVDFATENLAPSDRMIVRTRRRIIEATRAFVESGIVPPAVDKPEVTQGARSGDFLAPDNVGWLEAYADEVRRAKSPTGVLSYAAE